jgi:hypothetical protein
MKKNTLSGIGILLLLLVLVAQVPAATSANIPAFPGAEGAGANASGGRDGDLYFVTTLDDAGPGSFRYGIETTPAEGRTILFKVGGTIALTSEGIQINKENITIAGQTAPGDGICIKGKTIYIGERPPRKLDKMFGNNIIMRHLGVRLGVGTQGSDEIDNIWICNGHDIILDHISSAWSADEVLSASRDVKDLTVQYSFLFEPLGAEAHAFGSIIGSGYKTNFTWHHNFWAHCSSRNPRPSSDEPDPGFNLDLRNNAFYNWGYKAGYNGKDDVISFNLVNNYYIKGPSTTFDCIMEPDGNSTNAYQSGNMRDLNKNGKVDGKDDGWAAFCGTYNKLSSPLDVPGFTAAESAGDSYLKMLALGGATPWRRDPVDTRVVSTIIEQTGKIINKPEDVGGYPTLKSGPVPEDGDNDGMPDFWELALGLDPSNPADRKNKDAIGYTMLEGYLNWLADGHAVCDRGGSVDIDLRKLNGGLTFLKYTIASGTNGTVELQSDGYTVRFTAASNFSGLANFTYSASDPGSEYKFGPIPVGVLVNASTVSIKNKGSVSRDNEGLLTPAFHHTQNSFTITVPGSGSNVRIFNGSGELCLTKQTVSGNNQVDITGLKPGVYMLIADFPLYQKTFKFVKR